MLIELQRAEEQYPEDDFTSIGAVLALREAYVKGHRAALTPTAVSTQEEFEALPVHTLVRVTHSGGEPYLVIRSEVPGAASGGIAISGGHHWSQVWGWAESVEVLHRPCREAEVHS